MTPEQQKHNIEVSQSNLDMHQETKNDSHKALNNIIFVVGTGTFVLSISFLGNIDTVLQLPWLLIASWVLLIGSIAANGVSHWYTIREAHEQQRMNNEWRAGGFVTKIDVMEKENTFLSHLVRWGNRFGLLSIFLLVVGISLLTFFVSINLLAQNELRKDADQFDRLKTQLEDYCKG